MAEEQDIAPDYSSVDPDDLIVYQVPPESAEEVTSRIIVDDLEVTRSYGELDRTIEYDVEIEFQCSERAIDKAKLVQYLMGYQKARITQEAMASLVRSHLIEALGTDDVFVEVTSRFKKTWVGQIDS